MYRSPVQALALYLATDRPRPAVAVSVLRTPDTAKAYLKEQAESKPTKPAIRSGHFAHQS